ncbi:MAG: MFS transporter [Phycisphaerae bacterium]|nr:MFS transporter [Phycisphaerae bacterium]
MLGKRKSYDELPALSVRRAELRVSLRHVTLGWLLCIVFIVFCLQASHRIVFFRMVGFTDFHFGLLGALLFLPRLGQFVATVLVERTGLRKYLFIHSLLISRLLWLAIAAVPLVIPVPSGSAVTALLVIFGVSQLFQALGEPAWMTWMGDLIPRRIRGRFLATRERLGTIVRLAAFTGVGLLVDTVTAQGLPETAGAQPTLLWVLCTILAVGGLFGAGDILMFRRIREIRRSSDETFEPRVLQFDLPPRRAGPVAAVGRGMRWLGKAGGELLVEPLRDPYFRRFALYAAAGIALPMSVGAFVMINALENLGYSTFGANVLFIGVGGLSGIATARLWGRAIDRWGRRPVLFLASAGTICSAMPWFFVTHQTPAPAPLVAGLNVAGGWLGELFGVPGWQPVGPDVPLGAYLGGALACTIGGTCWAGVHLARHGMVLGFADGPGRSRYVAAMSVLFGIGGTVGGLAAGGIASALKGYDVTLGPFYWRNWHAVLVMSVLARLVALAIVARMPDPGARPLRQMVRSIRAQVRSGIANGLFYPWRVVIGRPRNARRGRRRRR